MNEYKAKALEIVAEWNEKSGEERLNFCRNYVLKGIREGRRLAHGDELDDAINSTYELVAGKLLVLTNWLRRSSGGPVRALPTVWRLSSAERPKQPCSVGSTGRSGTV